MADAVSDEPIIQFCGLRVHASRDGDRVTGRVVFPEAAGDRPDCPIDYRSVRPCATALEQCSSPSAQRRLDLVNRWHQLIADNPGTTKTALAERLGVATRTLYRWSRTLDLEGQSGLRDKYVAPPPGVLTIDSKHATDAVMVCAWWAFRINNFDWINTGVMHAAVTHLIAPGYIPADVLATIDCYYAWPCDRSRFRFKPFGRWARYDFETWLFRACDEVDYRRGLEAAKDAERVALLAPKTRIPSDVTDPKMRKREVLHRATRRAISDLAGGQPPASTRRSGSARRATALEQCSPPISNPQTPVESGSKPLQAASVLRSIDLDSAARQVVASAAPGARPLALNPDPQTVAESLATLDDAYRRMLLAAARGDPGCRAEAIATMPLWWDQMPRDLRNNIDARVDAWLRDHPRWASSSAVATAVQRRKVDMLLPHLRHHRSGAQRLCPAGRIAL
jgi:hypothetical protein